MTTRTRRAPKKRSHFLAGFTLIELLVVISIISLLSSIVLASLAAARARARDAERQSDLNTMRDVVEMYLNQYGPLTTPSGGWACNDCTSSYSQPSFFTNSFVNNGYIKQWPNDPTPLGSRPNTSAGYLLAANGTDYKILIFNTVESGNISPGAPLSRCPSSCSLSVNPWCAAQNSYAIYTPGAACW